MKEIMKRGDQLKSMNENMIPDINERIKELKSENKAILDISVYPEFSTTYENLTLDEVSTYYIPDTLPTLLKKAKANLQYSYTLSRLLMRWTQRSVDLKSLEEIFTEKKFHGSKIEFITKELVDQKVYSFCYENFAPEDFLVEFSPKLNLLGDIIGKILGFAKKTKYPILMLNQRLKREIEGVIPIFNTANMFIDQKERFFSRIIPYLRETRGVRWFIAFTVGAEVSPVGFVLAIVDP